MNKKAFAEIIESSIVTWTAQTWTWDVFPAFGSLLTVEQGERTLIGLVYAIKTGSSDPSRIPYIYQKTEEELKREQPHVFSFLMTTFSCFSLGFKQNNTIFYTVPPEPPKIHGFVYPINPDVAHHFLKNPLYLHLLFNQCPEQGIRDELILALIRALDSQKTDFHPTVTGIMRTYLLLTGNDYRRLRLFLQRMGG
jgi:hypothetical protein